MSYNKSFDILLINKNLSIGYKLFLQLAKPVNLNIKKLLIQETLPYHNKLVLVGTLYNCVIDTILTLLFFFYKTKFINFPIFLKEKEI